MGQMIVDKVVQLLSENGIRTEAAFPAERITRITEPVAAVSLEKAELDARTATVLVEIFAPKESGGYVCQQKALEACSLLETDGAVCTQGSCDFLSKGNVFRVPVKATFRGSARANDLEALPQYIITAGDFTLTYAVGFSAKQVLSAEDEDLQSAPWEFAVEQFFPWGSLSTRMAAEPFTLKLTCMSDVELYEGSIWTGRKRIAEEKGLREFLTGKAESRTITSE